MLYDVVEYMMVLYMDVYDVDGSSGSMTYGDHGEAISSRPFFSLAVVSALPNCSLKLRSTVQVEDAECRSDLTWTSNLKNPKSQSQNSPVPFPCPSPFSSLFDYLDYLASPFPLKLRNASPGLPLKLPPWTLHFRCLNWLFHDLM